MQNYIQFLCYNIFYYTVSVGEHMVFKLFPSQKKVSGQSRLPIVPGWLVEWVALCCTLLFSTLLVLYCTIPRCTIMYYNIYSDSYYHYSCIWMQFCLDDMLGHRMPSIPGLQRLVLAWWTLSWNCCSSDSVWMRLISLPIEPEQWCLKPCLFYRRLYQVYHPDISNYVEIIISFYKHPLSTNQSAKSNELLTTKSSKPTTWCDISPINSMK